MRRHIFQSTYISAQWKILHVFHFHETTMFIFFTNQNQNEPRKNKKMLKKKENLFSRKFIIFQFKHWNISIISDAGAPIQRSMCWRVWIISKWKIRKEKPKEKQRKRFCRSKNGIYGIALRLFNPRISPVRKIELKGKPPSARKASPLRSPWVTEAKGHHRTLLSPSLNPSVSPETSFPHPKNNPNSRYIIWVIDSCQPQWSYQHVNLWLSH